MMPRVSLLITAALLAAAIAGAAEGGFDLLSAGEYQSELTARARPGAALVARAADLNAPTISVMKPDAGGPIAAPVDIDMRFQPAQGATVNIGTLKILYGFLGLDITQRILSAPGVQVSASGLKASGARLPSGSHKLTVQVADNLGRTGRQPFEFTVR
ncbi:MAG: hypothetical protein JO361_12440 [Gammaproteobacteria bacterium]|nr:hypothetical protein [Gammaproteobacteria bacterium]